MSKFKIGDRVKVVDGSGVFKGCLGVVSGEDVDDEMYLISFTNAYEWFFEDCLHLVEEVKEKRSKLRWIEGGKIESIGVEQLRRNFYKNKREEMQNEKFI